MNLDPLLAPALKMAEKPVLSNRRWAEDVAHRTTAELETIGRHIAVEGNAESAAQLTHVAEALAVCVISLAAYARGVVPKVADRKPNANIIIST